jgi:hypothetical protein
MIREAVEESFSVIAPLPNAERTGSSIEDCHHIAQAIIVYAERMKRHIAELEEQVALTSRVDIKCVTEAEDGPPTQFGNSGIHKRSAFAALSGLNPTG